MVVTMDRAVQRARDRRAMRVIVEGVVAGLIGAVIPMLLFLMIDAATSASCRTPAILGTALFHAAHSTREVVVTTPIVLAYTGVHFGAFVAFGLAVCPASSRSQSARSECWDWSSSAAV